jgi:pimeloyl-ACP methyl ester carboxylesterase
MESKLTRKKNPARTKIFAAITMILIVLAIAYFSGPKPATPVYSSALPELPGNLADLEKEVNRKEAGLALKKDNEARIVWADSTKKEQTAYAVVYIHGFSSSQGEASPVHRNFAKKFGCNLYLARLRGSGLKDKDAMLDFTAEHIWESAREAYAIGRKIGKKVILMGTSNGALLALRLAATYPEVNSLVLYSPNIQINNPAAWLLNDPWGLQIAKLVKGGDYVKEHKTDPRVLQYWYNEYRVECLPQLEEFVETTNKPELFAKIKQPVLMLYYYKDQAHQDKTVKVEAMLKMFDQLGTPAAHKRKLALPNTGVHPIASSIVSGDIASVERGTQDFAADILNMKAMPVLPD